MAASEFSAEQVDRAVQVLAADPERFNHAIDIVTHAAPTLQKVLNEALDAGGWFEEAHEQHVSSTAAIADASERERMLRMLIAEETRLGMLVGVAVGLELASELRKEQT
ncbi:MAG TPA: hypothetical protein VNT22_09935 [Baekduia sp.]|nr:hypothetical protein [Baekduia sp.]